MNFESVLFFKFIKNNNSYKVLFRSALSLFSQEYYCSDRMNFHTIKNNQINNYFSQKNKGTL
jgi:hypothetical protein